MTTQKILAEVHRPAPGLKASRDVRHDEERHRCVNDHEPSGFVQAANLYRSLPEHERQRLVTTLAAGISGLAADRGALLPWALENFRRADAEFGYRLEAAVAKIERDSLRAADAGWDADRARE